MKQKPMNDDKTVEDDDNNHSNVNNNNNNNSVSINKMLSNILCGLIEHTSPKKNLF